MSHTAPEGNNQPHGRRRVILTLAAGLAVIGIAASTGVVLRDEAPEQLSYSDVINSLDTYTDYDATISQDGTVTLTKDDADTVTTNVSSDGVSDAATTLNDAGIDVTITPAPTPNPFLGLLGALLPVILIIGFLAFILTRRGMGIPGLGLGKKHSEPVIVPDTTLADVKGANEAVAEMQEVVDFLNDPERFAKAGARVPRGMLLVGPPGTGKTLLARAVAGQAQVPFFAIAGSDMIEMFAGLGASRVRQLFNKAREGGKAIIFIDEIDAIGRERGSSLSAPTNDEREQTLNALLVEMDGFSKDDSIIVMAATNRADVLDKALLRPGRFDRTIPMPAPDTGGRADLFTVYLESKKTDGTLSPTSLAKRTPGMTGADIEQVVNEAALEAARGGRDYITSIDMEQALATSMLGKERKSAVLTERDKRIIAWHEAGHTVAALRVRGADKPVSVSIIPRGGAGGATWMEGSDDLFATRTQHLARLTVAMAGRAGEEILLDGDYTYGAHGDLTSATDLAAAMVGKFGMAGVLRTVGDEATYTGGELANTVDKNIQELISHALERSREVLAHNRELLRDIAHELLDKETLTAADLAELDARHARSD